MKKITGSFLDGIACDIPSNNWTRKCWKTQFENMRELGMDTMIPIRLGWGDSAMYKSDVMKTTLFDADDLLEFFLAESDRLGFKMYIGLYDTYNYWLSNDWENEVAVNCKVIEEVWERYGHHKSFYGWYMCHEGDMKFHQEKIWKPLILKAKSYDSTKKILISPRYAGTKWKDIRMNPELHGRHFRYIFEAMCGLIDHAAFMDGHVNFNELEGYMSVTAEVCREFNIEYWSNLETFDRDMPWRFPPIEWAKMRCKLDLAEKYASKIITFEAPHFLSPYSMFPSAHGLYRLYCDYIGAEEKSKGV